MSERLDLSRYEGHTPGPWTAKSHHHIWRNYKPDTGGAASQPIAEVCCVAAHESEQSSNAHLIADAPALLDEVRRLRESVKVATAANPEPERHVLGAGVPEYSKSTAEVSFAECNDMTWPKNLTGRYRLILEKVEGEG